MPTFRFQARETRGDHIEGTVVEQDERRAMERLRGTHPGVTVLSLVPETVPGLRDRLGLAARVPREELANFFRQLAVAMSSGLDVVRALDLLSRSGFSPRLTRAVEQLVADTSRGAAVSLALTRQSDVFSPAVFGMVEVGEQSGNLPVVMDRLALMHEKDAHRVKRLQAALTYPALLLLASMAMLGGLFLFFLPKMGEALQSFHAEMTPILTMTLRAAEVARSPAWALLGLEMVVFVGVLGTLWMRSAVGRAWVDEQVLRVPVVRQVIVCLALSRLAYALGMMVRSGGSTDQALKLSCSTLGNGVLGRAVEDARLYVQNGATLGQALRAQPQVELLFASMVEIGEESGRLERMCEHLQRIYDERLDLLLDNAASLVEPLILATMGVLVGGSILLFMVPLAQMVRML